MRLSLGQGDLLCCPRRLTAEPPRVAPALGSTDALTPGMGLRPGSTHLVQGWHRSRVPLGEKVPSGQSAHTVSRLSVPLSCTLWPGRQVVCGLQAVQWSPCLLTQKLSWPQPHTVSAVLEQGRRVTRPKAW